PASSGLALTGAPCRLLARTRSRRHVSCSVLNRRLLPTCTETTDVGDPNRNQTSRETGLMWANVLRAFQDGKALTSDGRPSSWMRPPRVAGAQVSWPACHLAKGSASAVM